jgi:hypothetical protein
LPHFTTRLRGSEIVPYIAHPMPLREPHNIGGIVVGPAAPADAERSVRTMLKSLGVDPKIEMSRCDIPYGGLQECKAKPPSEVETRGGKPH